MFALDTILVLILHRWHLGFCNDAYLPTSRGFDTFNGFLGGSQDHYSHVRRKGYDYWNNTELDLNANGTYSNVNL